MTTTLNVSIRHVDPSEHLCTSEHDVTRASLGASTFHYILLPPNPRDEPLECVRARVFWSTVDSFKVQVRAEIETSCVLFS